MVDFTAKTKQTKYIKHSQKPIEWLKEILLIIGMSWREFDDKTGFSDEYDFRMPFSLSNKTKQLIAKTLHLQYRTVDEKFFGDI